jgi:HEAT repeat protein
MAESSGCYLTVAFNASYDRKVNARSLQMIRKTLCLSLFVLLSFSLVQAQDATAIALKYLRQEKNDAIRANAVNYLPSCNESECRKVLIDSFQDPYWLVRYRAINIVTPTTELISLYISALNDPDDMVWNAAIQTLIKIGEPAIDAIKKAVSDKNPFVRQGAIIVLAQFSRNPDELGNQCITTRRIIKREYRDIFLRALSDKNVNIRRAATESSSCFDAPELLDSLLKNIKDQDSGVRSSALEALKKYSGPKVTSAALSASADPAVMASADFRICKILSKADPIILAGCLREQILSGQDHVLEIDRIPNNELDESIINELKKHPTDLVAYTEKIPIDNIRIINLLFELAEACVDKEFIVRVAEVLRWNYPASAIPMYFNALKNSRHPDIRRMVAETLRFQLLNHHENKEIWKYLSRFIDERDPMVRFYVVSAGAIERDERTIPILKELAYDPDQTIRSQAISDLGLFLPGSFEFLSTMILRDLQRLTPEDVGDICASLCFFTRSGKSVDAIPVLLFAMKSGNPEVVLQVLNVLHRLDPKLAHVKLEELFKLNDRRIKNDAIDIVRYWGLESMEILLGILANEEETLEIREKALVNFSFFPDKSENTAEIADALYAILKKESTAEILKQGIIQILYNISPLRILYYSSPEMKQKMMNDPDVCRDVVALYGYNYKADEQPRFIPEFERDETPRNCRVEIAKSLQKTTDPVTIEKLLQLTTDKDPALRAAIAATLGEISSSVTLSALEKLLQDPDPDVREKAKAAIANIQNHLQQN